MEGAGMFREFEKDLAAIQAEVRDWAEKELAPVSDLWDQKPEPRQFPGDLYRRMGELGFIGLNGPTEFGGRGKSNLEFAALIGQLSYHDVAFAVMCGIGRLFAYPLLRWGTENLKKRYIADCLSGKKVCAFALSEPTAGSDAANLQTSARPGRWRVHY